MKDPDNIFSQDEIKQLKMARSAIRQELGLDNYDHRLDELNFQKILRNIQQEATSSEKPTPNKIRSKFHKIGSTLSFPIALAAFTAGAFSMLLFVQLSKPNIPAQRSSDTLFRGEQTVSNESKDSSSSQKVPQRPTILVNGDDLQLPGSSPAWLQILQLATESNGKVSIHKTEASLTILFDLTIENRGDLSGLRIALGLDEDTNGSIAVVFTRHK